jgi:hypothetical protein
MVVVTGGVAAMSTMHEEMHDGTEQQDQIGQSPHNMGSMLGPQKESADNHKKDQGDTLAA